MRLTSEEKKNEDDYLEKQALFNYIRKKRMLHFNQDIANCDLIDRVKDPMQLRFEAVAVSVTVVDNKKILTFGQREVRCVPISQADYQKFLAEVTEETAAVSKSPRR